jgi:hypothetical protein
VLLASHGAVELEFSHQALDRATRHPLTLAVELRPHLVRAIHPKVLAKHPNDLGLQFGVAHRPR